MVKLVDPIQHRYLSNFAQPQRRQLLSAFWIVTLGLFIYEVFLTNTSDLLSNFSAVLITFSALLSSYLWCSDRAKGLPIFPIFALTYIWTHAFPLVNNYRNITIYSPEKQLFASVTTSSFLLIGTAIWFQFVKSAPRIPKSYRSLNNKYSNHFFLFFLLISMLFNMSVIAGWVSLEQGIFSIFQGGVIALLAVSSFILGYKLGIRELSNLQSRLFIFLLVGNMVVSSVTLLLIITGTTALISLMAFIIGRKKIPVLPIVLIFICLSVLHYGKAEMRAKYWSSAQTVQVQPWEYPVWYSEWLDYGLSYIDKQENISKSKQKESFLERSSLIQMLLLAQDKTPNYLPHLNGETYAILPQLLVPRILNENKVIANEGTNILSIHYGLATRKSNYIISWGLLAESYANFGLLGCSGLAIVLGIIYGKITRWSINAPILSAQSLFGVLTTTYALQPEFTAGVFVSSFFQSSIIICVIILVFMRSNRTLNS
ncbi:hypothetical protein RIVM261_003520 [Rivularia sp. IAM M-261]|nr:hypothetical protein RIVM261_003520 [Rivularia sp. IAM M-261]